MSLRDKLVQQRGASKGVVGAHPFDGMLNVLGVLTSYLDQHPHYDLV